MPMPTPVRLEAMDGGLYVCVSSVNVQVFSGKAHILHAHIRRQALAPAVVCLCREAFCMSSLNASARSLCRTPLDRAAPPPCLALIPV